MKPFAKIRGRIVEIFGTQSRFAEALGMSEVTVICKLSKKSNFTLNDIKRWSELLKIPIEEIGIYFFAEDSV